MASELIPGVSKLSLASDEGDSDTTPPSTQASDPSPPPVPAPASLGRREESPEAIYAQSELPDGMPRQAKMFHEMLEEARREYRRCNLVECRHICVEILRQPYCPTYATVKALHLLSGTVSIEKSFGFLQQARQVIEEASRVGDTEVLQTLRANTTELHELYVREKAGAQTGPWPDASET